jgi:hypothetical protein
VSSRGKVRGDIRENTWWGYLFFRESAFPRNKHFWNRLAVMVLLNLVFPHGHLCLLSLFTRKNRQIMTLTGSGITHLFCYVYRAVNRVCSLCRLENPEEKCTKEGGVCSLRLYQGSGGEAAVVFGPDGALRTTCPHRFREGMKVFHWSLLQKSL